MTQMSTVKINLKQIKRIKRGQSKKDPNCRVRHLTKGSQTGAFGASKVLPPQTCRQLLPSWWQLYQRRAMLGSKQLQRRAGRIKTAMSADQEALWLSITKSNGRIIWYLGEWTVPDKYLCRICDLDDQLQGFQSRVPPILFQSPTWQGGIGPVVRGGGLGKLGNCACVASLIEALTPATIYRGPFWQEKPETLSIDESLLSTQSKNTFQKIHLGSWNCTVKSDRIAVRTCHKWQTGRIEEGKCYERDSGHFPSAFRQGTKDVSQHFHFLLLSSSWHPSDWWPGDALPDHMWSPDRPLSAPSKITYHPLAHSPPILPHTGDKAKIDPAQKYVWSGENVLPFFRHKGTFG